MGNFLYTSTALISNFSRGFAAHPEVFGVNSYLLHIFVQKHAFLTSPLLLTPLF